MSVTLQVESEQALVEYLGIGLYVLTLNYLVEIDS